jgi:hypothetical protein
LKDILLKSMKRLKGIGGQKKTIQPPRNLSKVFQHIV